MCFSAQVPSNLPDVKDNEQTKAKTNSIIDRVKSSLSSQMESSQKKSIIDAAKSAKEVNKDLKIEDLNTKAVDLKMPSLDDGFNSFDNQNQADTEKEEPRDNKTYGLERLFPNAKSFEREKNPVMSLVISLAPDSHFLKHLKTFFRLCKNKKVQMGQVLIVMGNQEIMPKRLRIEMENLNRKYDYPFVTYAYANKVPEHLIAKSSPIWIAHTNSADHIYEIGAENPLILFDEYGDLIVPNESN